ncbi:glycosyltransferase family A protein [Pseudomonas protegens]|uniref:glycosyltransferase family A protein n=1 Tax=Pseudomonas protegens TaxID=380021 RepID=UPI0036728963
MLTVLVPAYNHEAYIGECLEAACQIDIEGLKILVVDDGSTDETIARVNECIAANPAVDITLLQKSNSGLVSSLNLGLSQVKTEYLYLVASDDVPSAEGIRRCFTSLASQPQARFCIGGAENFFSESELRTAVYRPEHDRFFRLASELRNTELFTNYPSPVLLQSTIFRVSALRAIGGWDPDLILDDYPTFIKLLRAFPREGEDFLYLPEAVVVFYRHHGFNSYKNIARLFSMFSTVVMSLAPTELKHPAIAKAAAYYLLSGARRGDVAGVRKVLSVMPWQSILRLPGSVMSLVLQKLLKK